MLDVTRRVIPEDVVPGKRLGRHQEHDERSRAFAVTRRGPYIASRHWSRHVGIYDQGDTGSCTGNAMAGALSCGPFRHRFTEPTARRIYSAATVIDEFDGQWPPDDTGSSGLAVCKVARSKGYISSYRHCFSLDDVLAALQNGPVITGVNWYDSFDQPASDGLCPLTPNAYVRGGHEVCLTGLDVASRTIRFANSWSASWSVKGYGVWSYDTFARLLAEDGDATVPVA
jgi:hypothetical protein